MLVGSLNCGGDVSSASGMFDGSFVNLFRCKRRMSAFDRPGTLGSFRSHILCNTRVHKHYGRRDCRGPRALEI